MKLTNRWIASLNRSDELNQRIQTQKDPKTTNWRFLKPLLGALGPSLDRFGGGLGPLLGGLGPSWEGLGPLLGALGPSWDGLGGHLGTIRSQDRKKVAPGQWLAGSWGRFWLPKWVPKRPQIDPKTSAKSRRKMYRISIALGPVLDRS